MSLTSAVVPKIGRVPVSHETLISAIDQAEAAGLTDIEAYLDLTEEEVIWEYYTTQSELYRHLIEAGLAPYASQLSQVELGKNAASIWALARISNSLGLQVSELLSGL